MTMVNSNSWKQYYEILPGDDEGNKNMRSFSDFSSDTSTDGVSKLRDLVEDPNTVFLGASNGKILILHSPTNFGGTRTRKSNKLACLTGLGPKAIGIVLDEKSILSTKRFKGADEDEIIKCAPKEDIDGLKKTKYHTFGSTFIAAPFLRTAILKLDSRDPDELIYAAQKATEVFETEELQGAAFSLKDSALNHVKGSAPGYTASS